MYRYKADCTTDITANAICFLYKNAFNSNQKYI